MRKLLPVAMLFAFLSCKKDINPNQLNLTDKDFLNFAYRAGQEEIQNGQMALESAFNPLVRQFALESIQQYQKVQQDLLEVSNEVGFSITDTFTVQTNAIYGLTGSVFDSAYIHTRFLNHRAMLDAYRKVLNEGNHTYIKHYFFNRNIDGVKKLFYKADSISRVL